jgi:hypothetical protein
MGALVGSLEESQLGLMTSAGPWDEPSPRCQAGQRPRSPTTQTQSRLLRLPGGRSQRLNQQSQGRYRPEGRLEARRPAGKRNDPPDSPAERCRVRLWMQVVAPYPPRSARQRRRRLDLSRRERRRRSLQLQQAAPSAPALRAAGCDSPRAASDRRSGPCEDRTVRSAADPPSWVARCPSSASRPHSRPEAVPEAASPASPARRPDRVRDRESSRSRIPSIAWSWDPRGSPDPRSGRTRRTAREAARSSPCSRDCRRRS